MAENNYAHYYQQNKNIFQFVKKIIQRFQEISLRYLKTIINALKCVPAKSCWGSGILNGIFIP